MSQRGINAAAAVFSLMQQTRYKLLSSGCKKRPMDMQDLRLGRMLEDGKNAMTVTFAKITTEER